MALVTLGDLAEHLMDQYDPNDLVEMLEISSTELVERFMDKLEDSYEQILSQVGEVDEE